VVGGGASGEPSSSDETPAAAVRNGPMVLVGSSSRNESGDVTYHFAIRIELTSTTTGVFKTDASGDEEPHPLFSFDFSVTPNGVALSHGQWLGEDTIGTYQFAAYSWDKFAITITPNTPTKPTIVFSGKKIPPVVEKTFMQQYGTMVMIGGVMLLNMFVGRGKAAAQARAGGAAAATPLAVTAAGGTPQAAAAAKRAAARAALKTAAK